MGHICGRPTNSSCIQSYVHSDCFETNGWLAHWMIDYTRKSSSFEYHSQCESDSDLKSFLDCLSVLKSFLSCLSDFQENFGCFNFSSSCNHVVIARSFNLGLNHLCVG